ncbi:MAG: FHA domain-containing protein, partial [Planctomycetota bacterium]
ISVPEFIIGRGEEAHLRPSSELISRQHCAIRLKDGRVEIEDMGSRNGSFVNDEQIAGVHQAKSGDRLRVGRLTFEVVIDPVVASAKKPKVKDVADAASRTAKKPVAKEENFEDSITDWLSEPDDAPLGSGFNANETIQFNLEDPTLSILGDSNESDEEEAVEEEPSTGEEIESEQEDGKKKKKKKEYGKLPPRPKFSHDNSTSAAGDVLKKFFNRR